MKYISSLLVVGLLALSGSVFAGEGNQHAGVFLGATDKKGKNYFTAGVEYEYRLNVWERRLGLGLIYERLDTDPGSNLYAGVVNVHLPYDVRAIVGGGSWSQSGKSNNFTRVGLAYDYYVDKYSISPTVNFDKFSGYTATVYGVAVGMGF